MHTFKKAMRYAITVLLVGISCSLSACGGLSSPIDQAYYHTGGEAFAAPGGYTRTIFSTSNF